MAYRSTDSTNNTCLYVLVHVLINIVRFFNMTIPWIKFCLNAINLIMITTCLSIYELAPSCNMPLTCQFRAKMFSTDNHSVNMLMEMIHVLFCSMSLVINEQYVLFHPYCMLDILTLIIPKCKKEWMEICRNQLQTNGNCNNLSKKQNTNIMIMVNTCQFLLIHVYKWTFYYTSFFAAIKITFL